MVGVVCFVCCVAADLQYSQVGIRLREIADVVLRNLLFHHTSINVCIHSSGMASLGGNFFTFIICYEIYYNATWVRILCSVISLYLERTFYQNRPFTAGCSRDYYKGAQSRTHKISSYCINISVALGTCLLLMFVPSKHELYKSARRFKLDEKLVVQSISYGMTHAGLPEDVMYGYIF